MRASTGVNTLVTALLTTALWTATSGTAIADTVRLDSDSSTCHFQTFSHETVTGGADNYTGFAEAVAVALASPPGTIWCEVHVNGGNVASTPPSHGSGVLTSAGQVTFTAEQFDAVTLCTVIDWDFGPTSANCASTTSQEAPPNEVEDAAHPTAATFDGSYDAEPGAENSATTCFMLGLWIPGNNTCGAGFRTPGWPLCAVDPSLDADAWWSRSDGQVVIFTLHPVNYGVWEGTGISSDGAIIYQMQVEVGIAGCDLSLAPGQFAGRVWAV